MIPTVVADFGAGGRRAPPRGCDETAWCHARSTKQRTRRMTASVDGSDSRGRPNLPAAQRMGRGEAVLTRVRSRRVRHRAPNGFHAKLCGQGLRAEVAAACRLPRIPLDSDSGSATCMTPRRWCSAEALQRRDEAGPQQLQREVRPRCTFQRSRVEVECAICGSTEHRVPSDSDAPNEIKM
jgi:hypothetical protein